MTCPRTIRLHVFGSFVSRLLCATINRYSYMHAYQSRWQAEDAHVGNHAYLVCRAWELGLQRESSMPWNPMKFPDMHYILYHQTSYFKATIYTYKNMYSQVQKNKHDKFLVDTVNTLKRGVFCHSNASIPAHSIQPSCARDSTIQ